MADFKPVRPGLTLADVNRGHDKRAQGLDINSSSAPSNNPFTANLQRAKRTIEQAFKLGGNAANNYAEMGAEDLKYAFGLTDKEAQELERWITRQ